MTHEYLTIQIDDFETSNFEDIEHLISRTANMIETEGIDVVWDLSGINKIRNAFAFNSFGRLIAEYGPRIAPRVGFTFPAEQRENLTEIFKAAVEYGAAMYHGDDITFMDYENGNQLYPV